MLVAGRAPDSMASLRVRRPLLLAEQFAELLAPELVSLQEQWDFPFELD
jgi:hypothetical protein